MLYVLGTKLSYLKQLLQQQYFVLLQFHKFFVAVEKAGVDKEIRMRKLLRLLLFYIILEISKILVTFS